MRTDEVRSTKDQSTLFGDTKHIITKPPKTLQHREKKRRKLLFVGSDAHMKPVVYRGTNEILEAWQAETAKP